jgi:hypothetical protein
MGVENALFRNNTCCAAWSCREKGSDLLLGGVSLEYDPAAGPTKFMVGCEQGAATEEQWHSVLHCCL